MDYFYCDALHTGLNIIDDGLYLRISLRTRVCENVMLTLYYVSQQKKKKIGTLLPTVDGYYIEKRISKKELISQNSFWLLENKEMIFVPVNENTAFPFVERLCDCIYREYNSIYGIEISTSTGQ